jgi:hypothetical protein
LRARPGPVLDRTAPAMVTLQLWSVGGDSVGNAVESKRPSPAIRSGCEASPEARVAPNPVDYSLWSGAVAAVIGAVAGLTVSGVGRIAVWCTVTGVASVALGLAHDSPAVGACWSGVLRHVRRSSESSV